MHLRMHSLRSSVAPCGRTTWPSRPRTYGGTTRGAQLRCDGRHASIPAPSTDAGAGRGGSAVPVRDGGEPGAPRPLAERSGHRRAEYHRQRPLRWPSSTSTDCRRASTTARSSRDSWPSSEAACSTRPTD